MRDPFPVVNTHNFSPDQRTRVMLFAENIEKLPGVLTAQAEDSGGNIYNLPVEFVGRIPQFGNLTQIIVKLPDELMNVGDVRVGIRLRGVTGNKALVSIAAPGGVSP